MVDNNVRNVLTIAKHILIKADKLGFDMTPLKLMKLVYIANGVKLAATGVPLFKESVKAWRYGPVVNELYQATKKHGSSKINQDDLEVLGTLEELSKEEDKVLDIVVDLWADKSGPQLSAATHRIDTPWFDIWEKEGGKFTGNSEIPPHLIQNHYNELLRTD